jgi:hypothetical protein
MMNELDEMLRRLGAAPVRAMAGLDGAVMAGVSQRRARQLARRGMALACCVALFVGAAGTLVPSAPASAEPLLGMPEAAPSRLLVD